MTKARLGGTYTFITGGSRGIGRAVAERFAAEGSTVAINHYRDDKEAEATLVSVKDISRKMDLSRRSIKLPRLMCLIALLSTMQSIML